MAKRPVLQIGNPLLRDKARFVTSAELGSPELATLIADMIETMHEESGIGIAAPQIGESVRVAVIEIAATSSRYPGMTSFPLTVLINPRISVLDGGEQGYWEGCLSVPNLRGLVFRPRKIRVDYVDVGGKAQTIIAEGFLATVFQHELDHLDGILFVDKVRDTRRLATIENYQRFWLEPSARDLDI